MNRTLKSLALALALISGAQSLSAQYVKHERLHSFEENVPTWFSTAAPSSLSISDEHFRDGQHSLCWDYEPGAVLDYRKDLLFEPVDPTGKDTYLSCFILWVYNEEAVDGQLRFEFLKEGRVCTSFPMNINFTGWRGIWVCYERDMEGRPESGMDAFRIIAPETSGKLWFDHLIPATKVDERQQTSDFQVPFVHRETSNHWLVIYPHYLYKPEMELTPLTREQEMDMKILEERFVRQLYTPSALTQAKMDRIRKQYDFYEIGYRNGHVYGKPIYFCRHSEAYERMIPNWNKHIFDRLGVEMRNYFNLMKDVSVAYLNATNPEWKTELQDKFLAMYDNITDQGVAFGSCWGNIHHYGYSIRGMFTSYFLMKDVLRRSGRLDAAVKTLNWYAITNEIYPKPDRFGIDIDTFNTKLQGRFASILIMEDSPEKVRYLRSIQRWLNYGCMPADGLEGSFKKDGACFHHCNNYPAYAVGGLEGATDAIYLLHGTQFRLSEAAHSTVKNVLLTMRFYCNLQQWPLSMSGRHPNSIGHLIPMQYAVMALSGTPDGKDTIDADMARAYLRLVPETKDVGKDEPEYLPSGNRKEELEMKERLRSMGFEAEPDPQGTRTLGYGCVAIYRNSNWMAAVRGHSRYLWASEHYLDANFYGRYLAHGSMQIMTGKPGTEVTMKGSGWQEAGFDWNRIPGTTSIHLPFEKLRATISKVDLFSGIEEMLYSDEAFAGGLSHGGENGNFGMKLHEHDKYNGSLRARKSYHFFNGEIVALGSDIENTNADNRTETTVFQTTAPDKETKAIWRQHKNGENFWLDPDGIGYIIPKAELGKVRFELNFPQTTVGERSTRPTSGDWASLTFQHGKAPKGESYEYAVFPQTDRKSLKRQARRPDYKVLRKDSKAHIVSFDKGRTQSYVLFETPQVNELPKKCLLADADTSCLVMTTLRKDGRLLLTVSQPDLALYRGPSDELYDENGKRVERSIYSRPWKSHESMEIPVTVTLKGSWEAEELPENCTIVERREQETVLRFICKDAASFDILLKNEK